MISIAMTTYNGSKYIIKQLDSLRQQTTKPDEVIILDDCSKDDTVQITLDYIKKWGLTGWSIKPNKINLGWKRNFYAGCGLRSYGSGTGNCHCFGVWRRLYAACHVEKSVVVTP